MHRQDRVSKTAPQSWIPLREQRAPHLHPQALVHPHAQQPPQLPYPPASASPTYIKPTPPAPREAAGGDPGLLVTPNSLPPPSPSPLSPLSPNMIFSDLYRSPRSPFSKLRASHPPGSTLPQDIDADLVSKDKARQKEAVRKFLTERIRNDWDFVWPPPPHDPSTESTHAPLPAADVAAVANNTEPVVPGGLKCVPGAVLVDDDAPRDPGEEADSESDAESVYSTVSEDPARFRPRAEWTSDDDEARAEAVSPFRFDNPDAVGAAVNTSVLERRTRRRRAVREEVSWNPGLACFEARRNAWTGARTARVKPKPPTPISPASPRRLSFWRSHHRSESASSPPPISPLSPTATNTTQRTSHSADSPRAPSHDESTIPKGPDADVHRAPSHASSSSAPSLLLAVETLIPIPPPLLPPQNPMRASVTPSIYPSLYDKIVVHSLQPSCPVNLADMIRACVVGWKRDGEWPPRSTVAPPPPPAAELRRRQQQQAHARKASTATNASGSRRLSLGFLAGGGSGEGSDEGAGRAIRRSLQRVFSLGHGAAPAPAGAAAGKEVTAAG
ncbi:hypothetical protein QBC39DRAFT_409692 [Podospora conica]|nr:hypothetical protein QBC39DRAFT_409692 [Schizothecium conicum]